MTSNPDTKQIPADPEYRREICACVTQGADTLATANEESADTSARLAIMLCTVHKRIRELLFGGDTENLLPHEQKLLQHIVSFNPDSLGPDVRVLHGELNGKQGAFLVDIKQKVGRGGINDVFAGIELSTGRMISVRQLHSFSFKESFIGQEGMNSSARAQEVMRILPPHDNIVRFWGSATDDDENEYTILDFAPGDDLVSHLENTDHVITYGYFHAIASDVARALGHYHAHGLSHADVKPENVIVEDKDNSNKPTKSRIVDLDLMRTHEDYIRDIKLGKFSGSMGYMPPELFKPGEVPEDPEEQRHMAEAGDVYALGLTFYNNLTGVMPPEIHNKSPIIVHAMKFLPYTMTIEENPIPELQTLLDQMCQPDWKKRPSIKHVCEVLEALQGHPLLQQPIKHRKTIELDAQDIEDPYKTTSHKRFGDYAVIEPSYTTKELPSGECVELAVLLNQRIQREHIGIPYEFLDETVAKGFFEQMKRFFQQLNTVREKYPDLFPGTFDLHLERNEAEEQYTVWVIRGKVQQQVLLDDYLERVGESLHNEDRWELLERICRSLAALEEAGYRHPGISSHNIFLAPPDHMVEHPTFCQHPDTIMRADGKIMERGGAYQFPCDMYYYRLELMDTSLAEPIDDKNDPNVSEFISIMFEVMDYQTLESVSELFPKLNDFSKTWQERVVLLKELREQAI